MRDISTAGRHVLMRPRADAAAALRASSRLRRPQPAPAPLDASYDWHVLLVAPFGSVLKDVPLTLHEVLLFRDEAQSCRCRPMSGVLRRRRRARRVSWLERPMNTCCASSTTACRA